MTAFPDLVPLLRKSLLNTGYVATLIFRGSGFGVNHKGVLEILSDLKHSSSTDTNVAIYQFFLSFCDAKTLHGLVSCTATFTLDFGVSAQVNFERSYFK